MSPVPLPRDHHLLRLPRLSPCACHKLPIPVESHHPFAPLSTLCVALSFLRVAIVICVLLSHLGKYTRQTDVHEHDRSKYLSDTPANRPPDLIQAVSVLQAACCYLDSLFLLRWNHLILRGILSFSAPPRLSYHQLPSCI